MISHEIAAALAAASENDKAEFAHFLARELSPFGLATDDATVRQVAAALDRFVEFEGGNRDGDGQPDAGGSAS